MDRMLRRELERFEWDLGDRRSGPTAHRLSLGRSPRSRPMAPPDDDADPAGACDHPAQETQLGERRPRWLTRRSGISR